MVDVVVVGDVVVDASVVFVLVQLDGDAADQPPFLEAKDVAEPRRAPPRDVVLEVEVARLVPQRQSRSP